MTAPLPLSLPFYFGPAGAECFAWLHPARTGSRADMGLVICSPFGHEDQSAHRGLRRLAQLTADAGIATLRFDHHGCGDSAGADGVHDHPSAWLRSVHAAIDTLRERSGVSRVCLVGARLGVASAAQAASERDDVCALVALAPVLRGRGFLREAMLRSAQAPVDAQADFELGGHIVTARARAELAALDLLELRRPPADVLVVDADALRASERWLAWLAAQGARTEAFVAPALAGMLESIDGQAVPPALLARIAGWIEARAGGPASAALPALAPFASVLELDGLRETPLTLRAGTTDLFAILSEPAAGNAQRAVLLLNTGAARRVGPSRMSVDWARRWARDGVAVLRLDLPGLGDSEVQPADNEGEVYATETTEVIAAALALLRTRCGVAGCQLVGICSGAYHAYRAALAGVPVDSVVLVNQAAYHWHEGMHLNRPSLAMRLAWVLKQRALDIAGSSNERRLRQALHEFKWRTLRTGAVAYGVLRDAARGLRRPLPRDVGAELLTLARRGVAVHIVFADRDRGDALLRLLAGRTVVAMQARGELGIDVIDDADHIFTSRAARGRLRVVLDRLVQGQSAQAYNSRANANATPAVPTAASTTSILR